MRYVRFLERLCTCFGQLATSMCWNNAAVFAYVERLTANQTYMLLHNLRPCCKCSNIEITTVRTKEFTDMFSNLCFNLSVFVCRMFPSERHYSRWNCETFRYSVCRFHGPLRISGEKRRMDLGNRKLLSACWKCVSRFFLVTHELKKINEKSAVQSHDIIIHNILFVKAATMHGITKAIC